MLGCLAALAVIVALARWPDRTSAHSSSMASIVFTGFTNASATSRAAVFLLSNSTPRRLCYRAESVAVRVAREWITNNISAMSAWPATRGATLDKGDFHLLCIPAPANGPWRLHLRCTERSHGWSGINDTLYDFVQNHKPTNRSGRSETFGGRTYHLWSAEVVP